MYFASPLAIRGAGISLFLVQDKSCEIKRSLRLIATKKFVLLLKKYFRENVHKKRYVLGRPIWWYIKSLHFNLGIAMIFEYEKIP